MTAKAFVSGSWTNDSYGTPGLFFTDSSGTYHVTPNAGTYAHDSTMADAGVVTPSITPFCAALVGLMNVASPTVTHTGSFSEGVYTLGVTTGTLTLSFSTGGSAGTLMRKLLGFTADSPAAASHTSTVYPWFWLTPSKPGLTNYLPPTRVNGSTKESVSDNGTVYRLAPTSIPRVCSWEHHFEPKERVDRDYLNGSSVVSTHLYTWEDLWDDFGLGQRPVGLYVENTAGVYEKLGFRLSAPEYDSTVMSRMRPSDDSRFKIALKARLWPV